MARLAAVELESRDREAAVRVVLARRAAAARDALAGISLAAVPLDPGRCGSAGRRSAAPARPPPITAGDVAATGPRPSFLPAWVPCDGFAGVLAGGAGRARCRPARPPTCSSGRSSFPARAAAWPSWCDVPVAGAVKRRDRGRDRHHHRRGQPRADLGPAGAGAGGGPRRRGSPGRRRLQPTGPGSSRGWPCWTTSTGSTGKTEPLPMNIGLSVPAIYQRLSASQASLGGTRSFGDLLLLGVLFVSGLFLIIEVGALVMGLALARSITGAVHELFAGTERVRQGDFGHRIPVLANDQLGELANSFNQMTGSIEDLLRQAAEKKRLEEEMRLAREIQMSLLPRGPLLMPGMTDQRALRAGAGRWAATTTTSCRCPTGATACSSPTCRARACPPRSTWPS